MAEAYGYPLAAPRDAPFEADAGAEAGRLLPPSELPLNPHRAELPTPPRRRPVNTASASIANATQTSMGSGALSHYAAPGFLPYSDATYSYSANIDGQTAAAPRAGGPSIEDDEAELEVLRKKIDDVRKEKERMGELESMEQQLKEQIMARQRRTMAMEGGGSQGRA
jgi:hypothetical protein